MLKEVGESSNMHMDGKAVWVLSVGPQALMEVGVGERLLLFCSFTFCGRAKHATPVAVPTLERC